MSDNLIGATTAIFIVSLSIAVNEPVDVAWSTRDGTAKAGTDYKAANGVVSFLPGETRKQIEVTVYGQNVSPTGDKNFFINLMPPTNAVLGTTLIEAVIKVEDEVGVPVTTVIVAQGKRGLKGDPGLSAYEQAVLMGYDGTLEDWMQEQADAAAAAQRAGDYAAAAASAATKAENAATAASFLGNIFPTPEAGVDPVTGVGNGAYYNVRSTEDDSFLVEYQNIGGVPTPSGKSYPSSAALNEVAVDVSNLKEAIIDPITGMPTSEKIFDPVTGKNLYQISAFQKPNLKLFGENVGGGGDDSQAFINAAAVDRNYYIPSGTYRVDSNKVNINLHNFTAADKVVIYVDGVAKDYSGAFNGPFRSNTNGGSYFWFNGKTGKTLARWSDGASASDSHQFYLPLEVRADGHGFMLRQATRGAGIDILFQDELSDDLFYLKAGGTTEDCVFGIAFDTTPKTNGSGGGAGGFDNAIEVRNTSGVAKVRFPAAQVEFNQALNMRRRGSSATRNYQFSVNSANGLDLKAQNVSDGTDIALLMNIQDTQLMFGQETTFLPNYTQTASHRKGFKLFDGGSVARNVKKTFPITVGSADRAVGEFTIIYVDSSGGIFTRSAKFKANGSTVNFEESALNDVLPAGLVANVVYDGSALNLVLHNNDYAAAMRYTVKLEWLQAYY